MTVAVARRQVHDTAWWYLVVTLSFIGIAVCCVPCLVFLVPGILATLRAFFGVETTTLEESTGDTGGAEFVMPSSIAGNSPVGGLVPGAKLT